MVGPEVVGVGVEGTGQGDGLEESLGLTSFD